MRLASVQQVGVGFSPVLALDFLLNPTDITLFTVTTAGVNYTVQYTMDDIFSPTYNPSTGNWYNAKDTAFIGATGNAYSKVDEPITGARVNNSGSGSVTLSARQGVKG